jgi:hypothetical protein
MEVLQPKSFGPESQENKNFNKPYPGKPYTVIVFA